MFIEAPKGIFVWTVRGSRWLLTEATAGAISSILSNRHSATAGARSIFGNSFAGRITTASLHVLTQRSRRIQNSVLSSDILDDVVGVTARVGWQMQYHDERDARRRH
nr:hypothetical protein [Paraburkholderia fynbosensis]